MTKATKQPTKQAKRRPAPTAKRTGNRWVFPAVVIGIVAVLAVVLILSALGGGDDDSGGGGDRNTVEVARRVTVEGTALPKFAGNSARDSAVGMTAPTISSVDFAGQPVEVGGATGSPYALVFLAHWCPHCQAEVPRLVSLAQNGQIEGVDVTAIATGTSSDNPNYPPSEWLEREQWPFGEMVDDGRFSLAGAYGLSSYPFMVFVDANGQVAGRASGEVSESALRQVFRALAAGEPLPLPSAGPSSRS